ncbi:queuosine precursor transporter [Litorivivens sp.]|uniref:queuosine precursor transporter n=1 Tax=Litorivivens sp. TaxID=2020868 RepID=UPI003566E36C
MQLYDNSDLISRRREQVFLLLAGFFLCSMTLLNVIGITKFVQLGPMALAVGVLPYPLTFLCTDLVSELYGKRRANFMVTVGLIMNVFVILVLSIGNWLPAVSIDNQPPWQVLQLAQDIASPSGASISGSVELYFLIYATTSGAVIASMLAYVAAQYCDVHLYHFWRNLTKGRHLWLRNNFSTLISQGVDSFMVISVTFGAVFLAGGLSLEQMLLLMGSNYLFKFCAALIDTIPLYIAVHYLRRYLHAD